MFTKSKIAVLFLALVSALAPAAKADGFGISYLANTKHGSIAIGYSSGPFWAPGYRRVRSPAARWVPGHYETVRDRVWVPGQAEQVWVEPVFEWRRDACGRAVMACVADGHFEWVKQPGHYEYRDTRFWVPGAWRY